ncbi:hypothetical protein A0H81_01834 [Grifola frondosa]|uniref:Uncharacterized protein n=1 Tax=Grifola frondosa TaxID=5627 RepID=A0A1C7MK60_GRIFR|nr:hypothetical protein A0H81_01834 [Grifola frondosa]
MSPPPIPKVKEDRSDSQPPPASLSMVTSRAFTPPRVPPGYAVTSVLTYVRVPVMAPIDTPPDTVVPDLENHETIFPIRNACYYTQYSHVRQTAPQYQPREPFNSRAHELNARYPLSNDVDYEASCDATGSLIRGELDRYGGLRALPPQSDVFVNAIETWLEHGGAPPHGTKRARRPSASSEKTDREGEEHVPKRLRPQMSAERFDTRSMGSGANRSGSAAGSQAVNGHVARHVGPVPTPPWGETRYQRQHSSTPDTVHTESMDVDVAHPRVLSHPATSDRGSSVATVNGARRLSTPQSSHGDLMAGVC